MHFSPKNKATYLSTTWCLSRALKYMPDLLYSAFNLGDKGLVFTHYTQGYNHNSDGFTFLDPFEN